MSNKISRCILCGMPLDYKPGKPGRPPEFHQLCKKLFNILPWMEDLIQQIEKEAITTEKRTQLRRRLFSMSNLLNYKNR